ncbi:MAG: lytic transglycosylase domain-containing protein [Myxococcales bacterium]|nr:lytic transglycosylase domain-containing protein [Myxococcales bacterium]MDD9969546.1 lytic transglycosylase domain-containing protein [Myxococcales bacterium]
MLGLGLLLFLSLSLLGACATTGVHRGRSKPQGPLRPFTAQEWERIQAVQPVVARVAREHDLSPSLINGLIWVESKFKRRARGRRGPKGLLQLMPRTGRAMARRIGQRYAPYRAEFSVTAGVAYLVLLRDRFDGDLTLALAAYNAGPGPVVRWRRAGGEAPRPRHAYVARVKRAVAAFCRRLSQPDVEPVSGPLSCAALAPRS